MNAYEIDTLIQIDGSFVVFGGNQPIDPSAINLFVLDPTGTETEYTYPSGGITRVGTGNYACQITLTKEGVWVYKWQGTGAAVVTSPDTRMMVNQTQFSPPL